MTNSPSILPDATLIAKARAGSDRAFGELADRHTAMVYGVSYRMLRNREDAEDNLQTALFKAYRKIHQFEGKSRFSSWLTRIAINEAMMTLRKRGPESAATCATADSSEDLPDILTTIRDSHADPEREYIARDLTSKAFIGLHPHLRDIFVLHKADGWTHPELASSLGIHANTVKSRIFRTRIRLRQQLKNLTNRESLSLRA